MVRLHTLFISIQCFNCFDRSILCFKVSYSNITYFSTCTFPDFLSPSSCFINLPLFIVSSVHFIRYIASPFVSLFLSLIVYFLLFLMFHLVLKSLVRHHFIFLFVLYYSSFVSLAVSLDVLGWLLVAPDLFFDFRFLLVVLFLLFC